MRGNTFAVRLIGRFSLSRGPAPITLSAGSARVIAFLALQRAQQHRSHVAGQLWPELSEARARANLRNALWRTQPLGEDLLICEADTIGLAPDVEVDVEEVRASAEALIGAPSLSPPFPRAESFGRELLADWCEDWVLFERERLK
jgi:DNA-binding SARP family transcriptional activator